ncbi:MAG TPA: hypothetical protein ENH23_08145 [candidate division Zixibacteria bacterium]|nr:hypothetical protein [candidate division Zixibacteria bacterium]
MTKRQDTNIAIVASGGGSTGNVVMEADKNGFLIDGSVMLLISTKKDAGCIDKARRNNVKSIVIEVDKTIDDKRVRVVDWNCRLHNAIRENKIDVLVLAGCVIEVYPLLNVYIVNTHPANKKRHGGRGMYGTKVHRSVLMCIKDQIKREMLSVKNDIFTEIHFHEVDENMDTGESILITRVKIPKDIIKDLMEGKIRIGMLAERLQKYVLQYEYAMLPSAINIAIENALSMRR